MFPDKNLPAEQPSSNSHAQGPLAGDSRTQRAPVSGTMARVIPREAETLAELPSLEECEREEEATRISSPLRTVRNIDDEESTCQYDDLPTRVMHPPDDAVDEPPTSSSRRPEPSAPRPVPSAQSGARHSVAGPISLRGRSLRTEVVAAGTAESVQPAISRLPQAPPAPARPAGVVQPIASVVVTDHANANANAIDRQGPLELERALLRALTATAPRLVMPPVMAIRPAPPSPRMLAIVATFTTLGLMWVMAVCAMILVLVTR